MIDRKKLVKRHNPVVKGVDIYSPLSVGNGDFAFTVDVTGLQTFPDLYKDFIPLCTQSNWGWHTFPQKSMKEKDLRLYEYDTYGRKVGYPTDDSGQEELFEYLRRNPHRFNLGQIGLRLKKKAIKIADIQKPFQELDLWEGTIHSKFYIEDIPVYVKTCCHPQQDTIAVSIDSPLIEKKDLSIGLRFPYPSEYKEGADWTNEKDHITKILKVAEGKASLLRKANDFLYFVHIRANQTINLIQEGPHSFLVMPGGESEKFECIFCFTPSPRNVSLPSPAEVFEEASFWWQHFWKNGAALEIANSKAPKAFELERRIVLSQYLTAIQCGGSLPPQETGLTCNSWYGKFHLEMHWWHAAHFALWGRAEFLERSLWWYEAILEKAKKTAKRQGYKGARWPKMVGPSGEESPSKVGPLLIWQQPHPIMYAELCYRAYKDRLVLERYSDIVFQTAEFMASYAVYEGSKDRYVLGPPLIPAQECHKPEHTKNPTFELEYWNWGLKTAQRWKERLGLSSEPLWDDVIVKLAKLPVKDGVYLAHENCPDTFTHYNTDHPSMLAAFGMLPGEKVDREIMRRTLYEVLKVWRWETVWGWDYPLMAMTAARLGEKELAVEILMRDALNNVYLPNGHNAQKTRDKLPLYLPGNGGLLAAVAMMAAGWDGAPNDDAPGFPKNGLWEVEHEGFIKYI